MKSNSTGKTSKTPRASSKASDPDVLVRPTRARRTAAPVTPQGAPPPPADPKRLVGLPAHADAADDSWLPPAVDARHPDLRAQAAPPRDRPRLVDRLPADAPAAPLPAPEIPSLEAMGRAYVAAQDRESAAKEAREALGAELLARLQGEGVKRLDPIEGLRIIVLEGGGSRTTVDANAAGLMITQLWDAIDGAARQLAALGAPFAPPRVARTLPTRAGAPSKPALVVRSVALPRPRASAGQS